MREVHFAHVDLPPARLESADVEKSLHEAGESVRLLLDSFEHFFLRRRQVSVNAFLKELQVPDNDVDRRLELVRGNSDELGAQTFELGELASHRLIACG